MESAAKQWTESEKDQVRASLTSMLVSPLFAGSPRQQRFLDYLVTNTLAGDADRLKGYTIAVEVFDRKEDFDPSLDAIVRVEATRLRNKLREYYDTLGKSDNVRIDFPKGSYVLEISIQKTSLQNPSAIERHANSAQAHNAPRMILDKPSLAILPFVNIGVDNAKEYFADGVVDSLIAMFSRLSGLFVISRQSSFSYKSSTKTSKEIAVELGVRYLLEGSVQHAGNHVRVTAQLVDAHNGGQVWSDRYDRELNDIFALQDELTQNIVRVLQIKLDGAEVAFFGVQATDNIEAHDALLQGIAQHRKYAEKFVNEAIVLFKKTLVLDSNYAAAHAWLARSLALTWSQRWNLDAAILDAALSHAQIAVELDTKSSYAISILGWVQLWRKNREESIAQSRRAASLDPNNSEVLLFLSLALSSAGLGEEALYYIEKAKRFTPITNVFYEMTHGSCYYVLGDYKKAIAAYEQGCNMVPNFIPCHFFAMFAYERLNMCEEVRKKFEILYALTGDVKNQPAVTIWTDQALAAEQEKIWRIVSSRYS